jgi:hypothetical protein
MDLKNEFGFDILKFLIPEVASLLQIVQKIIYA